MKPLTKYSNETNYFDQIPLETMVVIFGFLNVKSQIYFATLCQNYRKFMKLCKFDFKISSCCNMDQLPYFQSFTNLDVKTKLHAFPKHAKILNFRITYDDHDLENIQDLDFPDLVDLKLKCNGPVYLNQWKVPSLKSLNIVECNDCILDGCFFPKLESVCCSFSYRGKFGGSVMPLNPSIIRTDEESSHMTLEEYKIVINMETKKIEN